MITDLFPTAPLWSVEAADWWMFSDMIEESDRYSKASLDMVRTIAQSLHLDAWLIPVMMFDDLDDKIVTPFEPYLEYQTLRLARMITPCATWIRPRWRKPARPIRALFQILATPYHAIDCIAWDSLMGEMGAHAADRDPWAGDTRTQNASFRRYVWWRKLRERYFLTHAQENPEKPFRLSPVGPSDFWDEPGPIGPPHPTESQYP